MNWMELTEEGKFFNLDNVCFINKMEQFELNPDSNRCMIGFIGGQSINLEHVSYQKVMEAIREHHKERGIV